MRHDIARKIRRSNIRLSPIFTVPKTTLDVRNWSFNVIPARKSARRCCVRPRLCAARPHSANRRKELMLAIWAAAHSDELLRTFHFAGPCVRMAMGV